MVETLFTWSCVYCLVSAVDETLPNSLCIRCANSAIQSFAFQQFCRDSAIKLTRYTAILDPVSREHSIASDPLTTTAYCIIKNNIADVISDNCCAVTFDEVLERLDLLNSEKESSQAKSRPQKLKLYCPNCCEQFKTQYQLNRHFDRVHGEKKYKCPLCSKNYGSAKLMEEHKKVMHTPGKCETCGKRYTSKSALRAHKQTHLLSGGTCQKCGKLYRNTPSLLRHLRLCVDGQSKDKFICIECGQVYSNKYSLLSHNKLEHSQNPYQCDYCGKKYIDRVKLKCHISTHTGVKHYQCHVCKAYFKFSNTLVYHMRALHTGERPFACEVCDKTFITSAHRLGHMRMYHGAVGPKCEACDKIFPTGQKLNLHLRRVHQVGKATANNYSMKAETVTK